MGDAVTDPVDATLAAYQTGVEQYVQASAPPKGSLLSYLDRMADLVGDGHVLEIGSGPGWDADHLESRGLRVTRTDATPAFVQRLRASGHDARRLDARSDPLGGPYQGVLADAVLLHLSRPQFEDFVQRARRAVVDGGVLVITLKEGDGAAWTRDRLAAPRYFTYWREAAVRETLDRAGWLVASVDHVPGSKEPWLYVLARAAPGHRTAPGG
jgi:SAM-dependent methyltransferase